MRRLNTTQGLISLSLVLALLWAQALGLAHRVAHAEPWSAHAEAAEHTDDVCEHEPGSAVCVALDQATVADAPPVSTFALGVLVAPRLALLTSLPLSLGQAAHAYLATGPPLLLA